MEHRTIYIPVISLSSAHMADFSMCSVITMPFKTLSIELALYSLTARL